MKLINYILFFFFNDTATTEIYTLSLHDALPISVQIDQKMFARPWGDKTDGGARQRADHRNSGTPRGGVEKARNEYLLDRKSTRLNSSHQIISYAVFCLKKKKNI